MANLEPTETPEIVEGLPHTNGTADRAYTHEDIQVLKDAEHIRKRPDMYIPDTGSRGLHHLVYELVYNSVDEALAGYCKTIGVTIHIDGSVSVADDGRGIPVDPHPDFGKPTLEVVLTTAGSGGKFNNQVYKVSAGLHGMGAKAVTALSEWTEAKVRRAGRTYTQEYECGHASTELRDIGPADRTGTTIKFRPDPVIFGKTEFDYSTLEERLRELAFLNRGLKITLKDERTTTQETFHYEGGVAEYVAWLNRDAQIVHDPIYIFAEKTGDEGQIQVEVAMQYTLGDMERVRCYANNAYNPNGGTHLTGFRTAVTRTINSYGEKNNLFKGELKPQGEDFRHGLTAVVNIQLPNPQFESQSKVRLNNPEVDGAVSSSVSEVLAKFLEENPKVAQLIIKKVLAAAEEREAIAKARESARKRKNILAGGGLPGKLMDCTSKGDDSELFLVEGDSAGGSAESGRNRKIQAILPLRGKPLNVEKAKFETLLKNEEIVSIISAVGMDIGNPEELGKIRYGKIVILTDADVDGQHIRTLLLTFFFRQMRKLVEEGFIWVARPPLYKVTHKKNVRFVQTEVEMQRELIERGLSGSTVEITPPNDPDGVRSITNEQLEPLLAALNTAEKSLLTLERRGLLLKDLLPYMTEAGLPLIRVRFQGKERWFHTDAEVESFRATESERVGRELVIADEGAAQFEDATDEAKPEVDPAEQFHVQELHELDILNRALAKLQNDFGFGAEDLVPLERIAGREPPIRYTLIHGESRKALPHLRDLLPEIRQFGQKGISVMRFKGLGEMDPIELWDTTLDPEKRSMLRVTLIDAQKADDLFRKLMGDEVEGRRKFIFEHGIDLQDIDYGA